MTNIFRGETPPVIGNARRLDYKVRPVSDLSMGEGEQRGYRSKRKYCTRKEKREKERKKKKT